MSNGIFITVRTNSTRLPKKALINFTDGLTTIEYLIKRVKNSRKADNIILCTTTRSEDDILVDMAINNNIKFFRGSVEDKLERWSGAASKFSIDYIVTADGDDLFCEPKLIDCAFEQFEKYDPDFIMSTGIICGAFTYGIKTNALMKVCQIKDSNKTEMMWVYFTDTGLFKIEELNNVSPQFFRVDIRMTLDYNEDLIFFKEVLAKANNTNNYLHLDDIIQVIEKNPELKDINYFRQNEFLLNQKKKTFLKIKI